ncbi:MAG TPA: HlyD family efflux transporter periplasmic adaptor subunit, partial [Bacteroidales bacterium]|nr:HlyD family efflux transporter periplasmic adaptor subunit [Bacteroidales bacterium]
MSIIPFSVSESGLEQYIIQINSKSRVIYWLIIAIIVTSLALLPLIYVDVSVQAPGFFQSDIERQLIISPYQGRILFTYISDGMRVEKGDTLLIIDSESIRVMISSILRQIEQNTSSIYDLEQIIMIDTTEENHETFHFKTARYKGEFASFNALRLIRQGSYNKKGLEHTRNESLFKQQIIPLSEYEESIYELNSEHDNLTRTILDQKAIWQNDLVVRRDNQVKLYADLEKYREELYNHILLSPVRGKVIQNAGLQAGSIITAGQKIAEISPESDLLVNCFVKPSDIGFIHKSQKVRIQVDAFNHNEWGMLEGEITDISDDMLAGTGNEVFFRVKCKPYRTYLSLKNGYQVSVKKGMSVNTRIIIRKRSLFNLLFDKADKWFNPYVL